MRIPGFGLSGRVPILQHDNSGGKPHQLGILAFETARTMSRLVSLHLALSDAEITRLCCSMRSQGVAYLNSDNHGVLLRVACAEMIDELDAAAADIARLSGGCRAAWPHGFQRFYADIKAGMGDTSCLGLGFQASDLEKKVKKMERYVASTSALYFAMKDLAELEAGERQRAEKWNKWAGADKVDPNSDPIRELINLQQDRVRRLREQSLWTRDLRKVNDLMARLVISLLARISAVFGAVVKELPPVTMRRHGRVEFQPRRQARFAHHHHPNGAGGIFFSGPLVKPAHGNILIRKSGSLIHCTSKQAAGAESWKTQALEPPHNSLGASGLALRYARVVIFLEHLAKSPELVGKEAREELYWMLPVGIRSAVRRKLQGHWKLDDGRNPPGALATGWKEAVEGILEWLAPIARDTERWHEERSFEQQQLSAAPRVMMLQTLMFSDKEKTEVAIVELLVAFSFVCRYKQGEDEDEY
ncbi:unnamed protein product [Spirodela intermedia]|uniref:Uncharacterized protein n=1 Tax=Spirodela intermedia TaxID=51605 RepID=A0A7I8LAR8_SPIIN|nr:unnamed protein product [Spirodela intermedia]